MEMRCYAKEQLLLPRAEDTQAEVLVLSGSFNPVHTQHIALLEAVRTRLANNGSTVAGGFLLPSSDDYVSSKLGNDAMALRVRVRLCTLVTDRSDWLHVRPYGVMSSYWATRRLLRQIEHDCAAFLTGRRVRGVEVMGSDTFLRIFGNLAK
jgi:nicotinic acid mononucleotide adenylyltransferase